MFCRNMYSLRSIRGIASTVLAAALTLTGCGNGPASPIAASFPSHTGSLAGGRVVGGQQPIVGAQIALYAAGTSGYGSPAQLLTSGVQPTASDGFFSITGTYDLAACQSADSLVYIVATGGNSGYGSGNNSAIALMAALGPCSELDENSFIEINELTTVAAVTALSKFMSVTYGTPGAESIGTTGTNPQGLRNAFATVKNLVDNSTGNIPGPTLPLGAIAPNATISSLANALATCINSDGSVCSSGLFALAKPAGQAQPPADTIQAALDIAQNPTNKVTDLFNLTQATGAPFVGLTSAPNDWTLQIAYNGTVSSGSAGITGGFLDPYFPAVDSQGNVWVLNNPISDPDGPISTSNPPNFVEVLSNNGTPIPGATDLADTAQNPLFSYPRGFEIDLNDVGWIANDSTVAEKPSTGPANANVIFKIPMGGNPTAIQTGTESGVSPEGDYGISVDGSNNVWFASNSLRQVIEIPAGSTTVGTTPASSKSTTSASPATLAADANGNIWVTSTGTSATPPNKTGVNFIINPAGTGSKAGKSTARTYDDYFIPDGLAIDANNNAWVSVYVMSGGTGNAYLEQLSGDPSSGNITLLQTCQGGGLASPRFIAVDGDGNVWATNISSPSSLIGFSSSCAVLTGPTGLGTATSSSPGLLNGARKPVIDGSGNIWLANDKPTETRLIEFIGVAAPTVTPIARALANHSVGARP